MLNVFLLSVFLLSFAIILFYILFFRIRFALYHVSEHNTYTHQKPLSVVICAKNEEYNLKINLPEILQQDYSDFEVIVVDDNSTDETYYVLKAMQIQYTNLNVIRLTENVNFFSGKKFPLSIGIRSAKHNHLVLTDADCRPSTGKWLQHMMSGFAENKEIVLGYGKYEYQKGMLNTFIRFETLYTAMQYFSFALSGFPYMGVGRNLAYTKELFTAHKGFSSHYNVASGDDDLFVNGAANAKNTKCIIHPQSFTISAPRQTWSEWWKQKRRHLTSGKHYKTKHKFLLSIYPVSLLMFYITFILTVSNQNNFYIVFPLFLLKVISDLVVFKKITGKLKEKNLLLFSVFFEFLIILTYGMIFLFNSFSKQGKWK